MNDSLRGQRFSLYKEAGEWSSPVPLNNERLRGEYHRSVDHLLPRPDAVELASSIP
jgi:hypothetical protein